MVVGLEPHLLDNLPKQYGGTRVVVVDHGSICDAIYLIINTRYTHEEMLESVSMLLMAREAAPGRPCAIVWNLNGGTASPPSLGYPPDSQVCYLDFSSPDWHERVSKLLEWTIVHTTTPVGR